MSGQLSRRSFLALAGSGLLAACSGSEQPTPTQIRNRLASARLAKMSTFGHGLFWTGNPHPELKARSLSRDEGIQVLRARVLELKQSNIVFDYTTVVNEAYAHDDIYQRLIGDDYIEIAFEFAREAFPGSKLVYQDYGNHSTSGEGSKRLELARTIVNRLRSRGLIDRVGLETILFYPEIPPRQAFMDAMQSYGVPVMISECSVNIARLGGTSHQRYEKQAEIYSTLLSLAIESRICSEFIAWQIGDKYSDWEGPVSPVVPTSSPNNDPTLFDDDLNPKPAYYAMLDVLKQAAQGR